MIAPGIQDAYELSPIQAGMLFQTELDPGSGVYVVRLWTRLTGPLDAEAFRAAWAWALARHPALRTGFVHQGVSRPVQVVHGDVALPLETADWSGAEPAEVEARLAELVRADRARVFTLSKPPLIRLTLARISEDAHLLLWSLHHLVLDGWSCSVVLGEVLARHDALVNGTEHDPAAPRPYRDFIAWLRGRDREAAAAFWRRTLDGVAEPTPLGIDAGPRRGETGFGAHDRHLSAETTAAVHEAARARRVTPATLAQGAWALVLARYAGTDDVVFGWTGAGRPEGLPGAARMVGMFVNTLPVRVRVDGEAALGPWLHGLQQAQLAVREHEHTPLVEVQGCTEVPRGRPLFESMLAYENHPPIGGRGVRSGLSAGPIAGAGSTGYPLSLLVHPGERMLLRCYQDRARIPDAAAERLLGHWATALEAIARAPADALLREIDILTPAERATLLGPWAGRTRPYPRIPVHHLHLPHAAGTPQRVAVTAADGSLTYAELEARANRLANHLVARGVRPGDIVGVALVRSTSLIVALVAILKAGAAYLPLDASYPPERLAFLLDDAGARMVVTDEAARGRLPLAGRTAVSVDGDAAAIAAESAEDPGARVGIDDPLYVVYTSGSTGTPKGVVVPHRALVRLVVAQDFAEFGPDDVCLQISPATFDAAPLEIWCALAHGGRVALLPPHTPTLDELGAFLRAERVTTAWLTAGLFHQMADARLDDLGALRQLLAGGDTVSVPHARRVMEAHPGLRLVHGYGPTENGTFTTTRVLTREDVERPSLPIGAPVPNTTVYVLDGRRRLVPVGVPGELYTGGDGVATGYLNRPELTEERFVTVRLEGREERVYRTGDRVRWLEDGALEFLGRLDFQVKIRGFRVEPGEVEAALHAHPAVRDAAVAARPDSTGGKRLIGWFVGEVEADGLRAYLRERLPEYMVPSALVRMDALPLNRHDKVDRAALPDPGLSVDAEGAAYVAPRTETEELLAALCAEVLGAERVGVADDFFAAGGHSLHAMQLVTRIREALRVDLPLRALFEGPTVAGLAARLAGDDADRVERTARVARIVRRMPDAEVRALLKDADAPEGRTEAARRQALLTLLLRAEGVAADAADPILPRGEDGPAPLSFPQQRLWFLDRLEPGSPLYNVPVAVRLSGALDAAALARALGEVVRRHQVLRSTFAGEGAEARQVVGPAPDPFPLPRDDLSAHADPDAEALRRAADEAAAPFDLARGPLFRARLLRLAADEHVLLVTMHHAVSDGWSMGVLWREVSALYRAYKNGEESRLPPLSVQYADFAAWQRAHLACGEMDRQLAWWKARLAGAPPVLTISTDRPRPPVQTHRGARERLTLPAEVAGSVREAGRREGATLFMTILAAWQALLGRHAGQDDVVVGSPVAGRTRAETEGLIGFFANTLALRGDLSGDPTFRALLARGREATLGAWAHQDLPFERLVEEVQPERSLGHSPVFQVLFVLQDTPDASLALPGIRAERLPVEQATTKFDLSLAAEEREDGLGLTLHYNADLWEAHSIRRLLEQLALLLGAAAADPGRRLSEIPLLDDAERARIAAWQAGPALPPDIPLFPAQFAARVAEAPDAVALVHGDVSITRGELDARANRLARHLRGLGVGPESIVVVAMERTPELVATLLGVLRAGGAYVPTEPHFPAERIRAVLAASGARVFAASASLIGRIDLPDGCRALVMDDPRVRASIEAEDASAPEIVIHPENLSHVIYTSGSTGTPKGVMVRHGAVAAFTAWMRERFPLRPGERVLMASSVSFDVQLAELHFPLAAGAPVLLLHDTLAVAELPADARVAQASMVATAARELLALGRIPAGLRRLNQGGEALSADLVRGLYAAGVAEVHNLYGPTEDTTYSTHGHCAPDGGVTIGRPLAGRRAYVLDGALRPAPVGIPGDLYLAGCGVARGYLGRPELTAERFVPDPLGAPGERMYASGDRARWLANGELEYLGRADLQVKVRGFRIEPGEVESVLRAHPSVADAVAAAHGTGLSRRLAAWVVARAGEPVDGAALAAHARERLPGYMVPAAFTVLDALPRTASGKVDRNALPAPDFAADEAAYVPPRTETERTVAEVFAQVLGVERAGAADDFFALGGHSLLAMHVWAHLRDRWGVELSLRALFEHPTVESLAAAVEAAAPARAADAEVPITPRRRAVRAVRLAPAEGVPGLDPSPGAVPAGAAAGGGDA